MSGADVWSLEGGFSPLITRISAPPWATSQSHTVPSVDMRMRWQCRRACWSYEGGFSPPGHPDIALSLYNISESHERVGDMLRAMDCACENLRMKQAALPRRHLHLKAAYKKVHHFDNMEEYSIDHAAPVQHF